MSHYLERAAEEIELALKSELHAAGNSDSLRVSARHRAADRFAELARIEHATPVLPMLGDR